MSEVDARITDVKRTQGTPWIRIHTDHPEVKRLSTKRDDLGELAQRFKESRQLVRIEYTHVVSDRINEHTGSPFVDDYFEGAEPLSQPTAAAIPNEEARLGYTTPTGDAWRMSLSKGAEIVALSLPHMEDKRFAYQRLAALAWAQFIFLTELPEPGATPLTIPSPSTPGTAAIQRAAVAAQRTADPVTQTQRTLDDEILGGELAPLGVGFETPPPHSDDDIPFLDEREATSPGLLVL